MTSSPPFVSGVVLAAGRARRWGGERPKQLFVWQGEPLVRRAANTALAASLDEVILVVGYQTPTVREAVAGLPVRIIDNPAYLAGQSTSLRAGLTALDRRAAAALFLPCDLPLLSSELLDRLIGAYRGRQAAIVAALAEGRPVVPALFDRALFAELAAVEGDRGGRTLFRRHADALIGITPADPRQLVDLDTPADGHALRAQLDRD